MLLVGGKNASLGEMYQELMPQGIRVPNGFAVTAEAYRDMLTQAGAWDALKDTLKGLDADDVDDLARRGARARDVIYGAPLSDTLKHTQWPCCIPKRCKINPSGMPWKHW